MKPVVYLDKDRGRIARYESAINPMTKRLRADLSHEGEVEIGLISEVDWEVIQFFRVTPPDDMAVTQTEPTTPEAA